MVHERVSQIVGRWFTTALVGLACCFVLATFAAQYSSLGIQSAADSIANDAWPSMVHLSAARRELRRVETLAGGHVRRTDEARPDAKALRQAAIALDGEWEQYLALPVYPGEASLQPDAASSLRRMHAAVERVIALTAGAGAPPASQALAAELEPAVEDLDGALVRLANFNASAGAQLAVHIRELGRRTVAFAAALDALAALLTAVMGVFVVRLLRRSARDLEDRADELEQFAGRVAHDVRNPLASVDLSLQRLQRARANDVQLRAQVVRAVAAVRSAYAISDDLLEFARAGAHPPPDASTDVRKVVDEVMAEFAASAEEARVELALLHADDTSTRCTRGVLVSLLSNLLHNAIKYMGDSTVRKVMLAAVDAGDRVRFEVADTGGGVPPGLEQAVFMPFVRGHAGRRDGSSGLGLATVKRLVEAHGGHVGVRSRPGQGAVFWFELPKAQPAVYSVEPGR